MAKRNLLNWQAIKNGIAAWANDTLEIPCFWEKQRIALPNPPYCVLRIIAVGPGADQWITDPVFFYRKNEDTTVDKIYRFDFELIVQYDITVSEESDDDESTAGFIDSLISGILVTGNEVNPVETGRNILDSANLQIIGWNEHSVSYDDENGPTIFDVHTYDITFRSIGYLVINDVAVIKRVDFQISLSDSSGNETASHDVTVQVE
jgi:hypothetical protein